DRSEDHRPARLDRDGTPQPHLGRVLPGQPHRAGGGPGRHHGRAAGAGGGSGPVAGGLGARVGGAPARAYLGGVPAPGAPQQRPALFADRLGTAVHRIRPRRDPQRLYRDSRGAGRGGRVPGRTAHGAEGLGRGAGLPWSDRCDRPWGAARCRRDLAVADGDHRGRSQLRGVGGAGPCGEPGRGAAGRGGRDGDGLLPHHASRRAHDRRAAGNAPLPLHVGGHRVPCGVLLGPGLPSLLSAAAPRGRGEHLPRDADDRAGGDPPRGAGLRGGPAAPGLWGIRAPCPGSCHSGRATGPTSRRHAERTSPM
ncbi:MAG: Permease of the drug/metabolite transporter (DMT) superfamily, partial [uncultured Rubellimicrobium sp.]